MFSRSMSSLVITETVAGTSESGRRLRIAAVVTASSWVGTACGSAGVWIWADGAVAAGFGLRGEGVGVVCAAAGSASAPPMAVVAINA